MSIGDLTTWRIPTVEVVICGDLNRETAPRVNEMFNEALTLAPELLVIDLEDCPAIDAAGIQLLLDAHRRAIHDGRRVALRGLSERLRRNLRLARADRVLTIVGEPLEDDYAA